MQQDYHAMNRKRKLILRMMKIFNLLLALFVILPASGQKFNNPSFHAKIAGSWELILPEKDIDDQILKDIRVPNPIRAEENFLNFAVELFLQGNHPDFSVLKNEHRVFSGVSILVLSEHNVEKLRSALTSFKYKVKETSTLWGKEGISYKYYIRNREFTDDELTDGINAYLRQDSIPKENVYYLNLNGMFPVEEWKYLNLYSSDNLSIVVKGKNLKTYIRQNGNYFVHITSHQADEGDDYPHEYLFDVSVYIIDENKGGAFNARFEK